MKIQITVWTLGVAILASPGVRSIDADPIPLSILYLSRNDAEERTAAFEEFFSARFRRCIVENREDYTDDLLDGIDVVVFDWSQRERTTSNAESPLGSLEQWATPTVFLGSAGLHMAKAWQVIGDAG